VTESNTTICPPRLLDVPCPRCARLAAVLRRLSAAYDMCESSRGAFSCTDPHDCRCPVSRELPSATCECGRDELEVALSQARAALDEEVMP